MYPDVVVIGGGIIGCACAYYLSHEGLAVHLVERGALVSGASGAGEGGIAAAERPGPQAQLATASALLYRELAAQLPVDIEYRSCGTLYVAENEGQLRTAGQMWQEGRLAGGRCELLDPAEVADLEPSLAATIAGAILYLDGGQINPHLATWGMALAAKTHGAVMETGAEVRAIELSHSRKVQAVITSAGRIATHAIVNAAGAWSGLIGKMVGLQIPVLPRKGHVVVTEPVAPVIRCTTVSEIGYLEATLSDARGLSVALEMEQPLNGNLLLGMSREFVGFDTSVDLKVAGAIIARNLHFFPGNKGVNVIRMYAGLRPHTPDNLPIISEADGVPGFYIATGHEGEGQSLAPITGRLIAEMITGKQPDLPIGELSLSRFKPEG